MLRPVLTSVLQKGCWQTWKGLREGPWEWLWICKSPKKKEKFYQWVYAELALGKLWWSCMLIKPKVCFACLYKKQLTQDFPYQAKINFFSVPDLPHMETVGLWRNNWVETQRITGQGCIAMWTGGLVWVMQVTERVQQDTQGLSLCCSSTEGRTVPNTWCQGHAWTWE